MFGIFTWLFSVILDALHSFLIGQVEKVKLPTIEYVHSDGSHLKPPSAILSQEFDYIVIGAGSAGCIVAEKLSRDLTKTVLLIERGSEESYQKYQCTNASNWMTYWRESGIDSLLRTVPQKYAMNRIVDIARTNTLGGCSSGNASMYVRGNPSDFSLWETKHLCGPKWSPANVLKGYKQLENPSPFGTTGYISSRKLGNQNPRTKEFIKAAVNSGHPVNPDYNSFLPSNTGIGVGSTWLSINPLTDKRTSSYSAYIEPIRDSRPNLFILDSTVVVRIDMEETSPSTSSTNSSSSPPVNSTVNPQCKATGLSCERVGNGMTYPFSLKCRGRVVLSAGAVGSPQLLLLSGIGPKSQIEDVPFSSSYPKINQKINVPGVGSNLQDHVLLSNVWVKAPWTTPTSTNDNSSGTESLCFYKSKYAKDGVEHPSGRPEEAKCADMQIVYFDGPNLKYSSPALLAEIPYSFFQSSLSKWKIAGANDDSPQKMQSGTYDKVINFWKTYFFDPNTLQAKSTLLSSLLDTGYGVMCVMNQPGSKGYLALRSTNPHNWPLVDPGYFSDWRDLAMCVEAIKKCREIGNKMGGWELLPSFWSEVVSFGQICDTDFIHKNKFSSVEDQKIAAVVLRLFSTTWHLCGSCKMGNLTIDPMAVVDSNTLLVRGTSNIHVADASVMPIIPSGNTNAPSLLIGNQGANFIMELDNFDHSFRK